MNLVRVALLLIALLAPSLSHASDLLCDRPSTLYQSQHLACEAAYKAGKCEEFKSSFEDGVGLVKSCSEPSDILLTSVTCSPLIMSAGVVAVQRMAPGFSKRLPDIATKVLPFLGRFMSVLAVPATLYTVIDFSQDALEKDKKCFEDIESKKSQLILLKNSSDYTRTQLSDLITPEQSQTLSFSSHYLQDEFIKNLSCSRLREITLQEKRKFDQVLGPLLAQNKIAMDPRFEVPFSDKEKRQLNQFVEHFSCLTPVKQAQLLCALGNTAMSGKLIKDFLAGWKVAPKRELVTAVAPASQLSTNQQALKSRFLDMSGRNSRHYGLMVQTNLERHHYLVENANGAQLFHGSTSSSLLGFTGKNPAGLVPTGELIKQGKPPFSGEVGRGVSAGGINQTGLSTVEFGDVDVAIGYAKNFFNQGWNPSKGKKTLVAVDKIAKEWGRDPKGIPGLNREIELLRMERWKTLSREEKKIVQDGFPVLYGIRPNEGRSVAEGMLTPSLGFEVAIKGGASASEVRVIFVPEDKVELVRKLISPGTQGIRVAPIEPVITKAWDDDQIKQHIRNSLYPRSN